MSSDITVLHVDDEVSFSKLVGEYLEREDDRFDVHTTSSASAGLQHLRELEVDCVISDYEMPGMDGLEFYEAIQSIEPDLPFILYTGKGSEEVASEAISKGVTDYLQKGGGTSQYTLLANRTKNVVARHRAEQSARSTRQRYRHLTEESTDVICIADEAGILEYVSPAAERVLGHDSAALIDESGYEFVHPADRHRVRDEFSAMLDDPEYRPTAEFRFGTADGEWIWLEAAGRNLLENPAIEGFILTCRDISERKDREEQLERYHALFDQATDAIVLVEYQDDAAIIQEANQRFNELFAPKRSVAGRQLTEVVEANGAAVPIEAEQSANATDREILTRETVDGPKPFHLERRPVQDCPSVDEDCAFVIYSELEWVSMRT